MHKGAHVLIVEQFFKILGVIREHVFTAHIGVLIHIDTELGVREVRHKRGKPGSHSSISITNP